jgi:hypothetical protein
MLAWPAAAGPAHGRGEEEEAAAARVADVQVVWQLGLVLVHAIVHTSLTSSFFTLSSGGRRAGGATARDP